MKQDSGHVLMLGTICFCWCRCCSFLHVGHCLAASKIMGAGSGCRDEFSCETVGFDSAFGCWFQVLFIFPQYALIPFDKHVSNGLKRLLFLLWFVECEDFVK